MTDGLPSYEGGFVDDDIQRPVTADIINRWEELLAELSSESGHGTTIRVASSDAPTTERDTAQFLCDGVSDEVEINSALATLPEQGGTVQLVGGNFSLTSKIRIWRDGQTLLGNGVGYPSGSSTATYTTGSTLSGTILKTAETFSGDYAIDIRPGTLKTTLSGAVTAGANAVTLNSVSGLPPAGEFWFLGSGGLINTASYTGISGSTLTGVTGVDYDADDGATVWAAFNVVTSLNGALTSTTHAITNCANNGSGLIRVTSPSHGLSTSNTVYIEGVLGTTEANGTWTVTRISASQYDLQGSTFTNAYVSDGTGEKPQNVTLTSVTGIPTSGSGSVWVQGRVIGTGQALTWTGISGNTLQNVTNVPSCDDGAQVNYAQRSLAGIRLRHFSLDGKLTSGFVSASGIYMQAYASKFFDIKVQRFGGSLVMTDGGGSTTSATVGVGPRGAWDNVYLMCEFRQATLDCLQLTAGSSDNLVQACKFAAFGRRGIYVQTGSGCQIVGCHVYGATTATDAAINADSRQLVVDGVRIANVGSGGIYVDAVTAQGGGATIGNVNIRDCNVLNYGTRDAINIRAKDGATIRGAQINNVAFQSTDDSKRPRYLINLDDVDDSGNAGSGTGTYEDAFVGGISWGAQNQATTAYTTGRVRVGRPGTTWIRPRVQSSAQGVTYALTDAATIAVDCENGDYFTISTNAARAVGAPTNLLPGYILVFEMLNNGGSGALTWNAVYKLAGSWTDPANGKKRTITFKSYDGTNLMELSRSPADITP